MTQRRGAEESCGLAYANVWLRSTRGSLCVGAGERWRRRQGTQG